MYNTNLTKWRFKRNVSGLIITMYMEVHRSCEGVK